MAGGASDDQIPGQMDVYDCLRVAASDEHGQTEPTEPSTPPAQRKLTAAEVVALRLREGS